jgi:Transposase DDE domain
MPWYPRVLDAIHSALVTLAPTQRTNLALLVSAMLAKRTCCLSELARAYPTPAARRVPQPKHDLLHRLKRLWRFIDNARIDPIAIQAALIPYTIATLGHPRWVGLAIDWTMFDTVLPTGVRRHYQVLRIAIPRRGRALPLIQFACRRDHWPPGTSQNLHEERALLAVIEALPPGVRPVVVADRGFARASLIEWLQQHRVDYVIRVKAGIHLTEAAGRRYPVGGVPLRAGQLGLVRQVRYGLYHGRPRELVVNVAICWRVPRHQLLQLHPKLPKDPWYLATSLASAQGAVAWYEQRAWIEQSFKDAKSRFGLAAVQLATPARLNRLLMAMTIALGWLTLMALPEVRALSRAWPAHVSQRGRASLISLALAWLDEHHDIPSACLPSTS